MSAAQILRASPQAILARKEKTAGFNRLLRFRFSGLWRERHGGCSFISDDEEGRTMLKVLLRVGTTEESAIESAPWLTKRELKALQKAGRKIPWGQIGEVLKLTYIERSTHKLFYWMPIDVAPKEVRRRQAQRNREMAHERQRKRRAKNKALREMVDNCDTREHAIVRMLAGEMAAIYERRRGVIPPPWLMMRPDGWTPVSALVKRAKTVRAFRRPDGFPLHGLRKVVHRALDQLEADGEIETKTVPGARGQVRLVHLADGIMTAEGGSS